MKTCSKCGAQLEDSAKFCNTCGAALEVQNNTPVQPAPSAGQPVPPVAPVPYNNPQMYQQPRVDNSDHTAEYSPEDISKNKVIAMCTYVFGIFGIIIALMMAKESPFVQFHIKEALKIHICLALALFANVVPILGVIVFIVWAVISVVLIIIAFVNVCRGKAKDAPMVGSFDFLK